MGTERAAVPQRSGSPETVVRALLRDMRFEETEAGIQGVAERRSHTVPGAAEGQRIQLLRVVRQKSYSYAYDNYFFFFCSTKYFEIGAYKITI